MYKVGVKKHLIGSNFGQEGAMTIFKKWILKLSMRSISYSIINHSVKNSPILRKTVSLL